MVLVAQRHESFVLIDPVKLMREFRRRGLSAAAFGKLADVSPNTLSAILNGKPCSTRTAKRIAKGLAKAPLIEGLTELLLDEHAA
jgi:predicted transcriptional regulator